MAINATLLLEGGSTDNQSTPKDTASYTPSANVLVLAAIAISFASDQTVTLSGNGLTWVEVATRTFDTTLKRITLFRAMGASPTTGALTITPNGALTGWAWGIQEFSGVDTSGTNGSGAIVQSATAAGTGSQVATLAAFADAVNNATFGAIAGDTNAAPTVSAGFTELAANNGATPGRNLLTEWRLGEDTTVGNGMGGAAQIGIIAAEIKMAAAANTMPVKSQYYRMMGVR
jgi:hypothetical protein